MKKALMFLMIAMLVAGCVRQTGPSVTGEGLQITSFTSDVDEQFSGRDVRLYLELENGGENVINDTKTLIYLSGPVGTGLLQWHLMDGNRTETLRKSLNPYDPLRDIPPGRETMKWTIRAPQLDPGQQKTDTFTARAYYDYETKVIGEMTAYSEAESVAAQQRGDQLEKATFTASAGPIDVSVKAIPDPVIVIGGGDSTETMTLQITIENAGGVTLYMEGLISAETMVPTLAYDDLNIVNLEIDAGALDANVEEGCSGEHELIGGKPTTISCDIKVPMPATKTTYPIKISLGYGYYIDAPITLTAVGKR